MDVKMGESVKDKYIRQDRGKKGQNKIEKPRQKYKMEENKSRSKQNHKKHHERFDSLAS